MDPDHPASPEPLPMPILSTSLFVSREAILPTMLLLTVLVAPMADAAAAAPAPSATAKQAAESVLATLRSGDADLRAVALERIRYGLRGTSFTEALVATPWGTMLRGWDVYEVEHRVLFVYEWCNKHAGPPGVCEFRPDVGFVGHAPLAAVPRPSPPRFSRSRTARRMRPRQISVCRSNRSQTAQASSRRARNSIVLIESLSGSGSSRLSIGRAAEELIVPRAGMAPARATNRDAGK